MSCGGERAVDGKLKSSLEWPNSRAFQKKCQPLLLRNCHFPGTIVTVSLAGMMVADMKEPEMFLPFHVIAGLSTVSLLVYMCALILNWIYRNGRFGLESSGDFKPGGVAMSKS